MKILIAVPTFDHKIDADCFKSIYGLQHGEHQVMFDFVKGYNAARARSLMALELLEGDFDYMLSVDADMVLPAETIIKLVPLANAHHGIAFGWYHRRQQNTDCSETFIYREGEENFGEHNNVKVYQFKNYKEPFRVCANGLGIAMIHRQIFENIPRPWFEFVDYNRTLQDDRHNVLDDSTSFCAKASNFGYEMWCDPTVRAFHITDVWL